MAYNLTDRQKEAVRWLVEGVQAGEIPEEDIYLSWDKQGANVGGYDGDVPDVIKRGVIDVLGKEDLLHVRRTGELVDYSVTLRQSAYDAVESGFSE